MTKVLSATYQMATERICKSRQLDVPNHHAKFGSIWVVEYGSAGEDLHNE